MLWYLGHIVACFVTLVFAPAPDPPARAHRHDPSPPSLQSGDLLKMFGRKGTPGNVPPQPPSAAASARPVSGDLPPSAAAAAAAAASDSPDPEVLLSDIRDDVVALQEDYLKQLTIAAARGGHSRRPSPYAHHKSPNRRPRRGRPTYAPLDTSII